MKKKLLLIVALFIALTVSVGTYAATYPIASATVNATVGAGQIVSVATAGGQPNWNSLLPHSEPGQVIMRPMGAGDTTDLAGQFPTYGAHWDKVAEASPDESATTVYGSITSMRLDLYQMTDRGLGNGSINNVTVYFRITGTGSATAFAQGAIKTGGSVYLGTEETQAGGLFSTRSYQWGSNPQTSVAWTWDDIDALQAGVQMRRSGNGVASCTQVYVVVDYTTTPIISGAVPTGDLYTVTPSANYTGDLMVKVYITNLGALLKAYRVLNMKVYVAGSLEAAQTPNYQVLSLENGVVIFNIDGGTAPSYPVQITGGSYLLLSGYTADWSPGWSITPEFYCEVTQR